MLLGRSAERARIDQLLDDARSGLSGVLILHGEAGIGKTTLLQYAAEQAQDMRILSTRGFETESEIPFSGLADLLRPVLSLLPSLPHPQAAALESALALGPPLAGDRFSVCAATLSVLAAAAAEQPTLLLVDDLQWMDASSTEALLFAARRLHADDIAVLCAARDEGGRTGPDLRLPELRLIGLGRHDAVALSRALVPGLPRRIGDHLYESTAGNPLGMIELAEAWQADSDDATGPFLPAGSRIELAIGVRIASLPEATRRALVIVAAQAGGETGIVLRAMRATGVDLADLAPAEAARVLEVDNRRIQFRHPLLRSVLYQGASTEDRCTAHAALAEALADVPGVDAADARAWHLAAATLVPDDGVAELLEKAAQRARQRAAYVAAARGFAQAARLSGDDLRSARLVRAARCWLLAGENANALPLLDEALPLATDPRQRAVVNHVTAYIRMWRDRPSDYLHFLVDRARDVEHDDPGRAAQMYADAAIPCVMIGDIDGLQTVVLRAYELGRRVGGIPELSATVAMAGALALDRRQDTAAELLRACQPALEAVDPLVRAQDLCHAAYIWIWLEDHKRAEHLLDRVIERARRSGAMGVLPQALSIASEIYYRVGRWTEAGAAATESARLAKESSQANLYALFFSARMDAVQGRAADCVRAATRTDRIARRLGVRLMPLFTGHELALLALGESRTKEAVDHLETVSCLPVAIAVRNPAVVPWVFDLVEAYGREGRVEEAEALLAAQSPSESERWARAAAARCRALLTSNGDLHDAFDEALAMEARAGMPFERARTLLCFGERLRRARHRLAARKPLREAWETFDRLGAAPWAERASNELRATGETVRRGLRAATQLTPQEIQVALLVARGASNQEAAAALFLSLKTIEYHLSNIYRKTNIHSRTGLAAVAA
jgi:DNA-binding NarL/FixJ family response regulator